MIYSILILSKETYTYQSLRYRLLEYFSESYIKRVKTLKDIQKPNEFCKFTVLLYDNQNYSEEDEIISEARKSTYVFPLFTNAEKESIIDCKRLKGLIEEIKFMSSEDKVNTHVLISYVSVNNRERYITDTFAKNNCFNEMALRLDLMSSFYSYFDKLPENTEGELTKLLELASSGQLSKEDIPDYCVQDSDGFLTPGTTKSPEDVFKYGSDTWIKLIEICERKIEFWERIQNVLIVTEGLRIDEIIKLCNKCTSVSILFYSRESSNTQNIESGLKKLLKTLPPETDVGFYYYYDIYEVPYNDY